MTNAYDLVNNYRDITVNNNVEKVNSSLREKEFTKKNEKQDSGKDKLTISKEAREKLKQELKETQLQANQIDIEQYLSQLEDVEKSKKGMEDMAKLLAIARRIAKGDKVPPKDEKKLMEFNAELYQIAKAAAILNADKKSKKHKSLFDDEEKNDLNEKLRELDSSDPQSGDNIEVSEETALFE